MKNKLPIMLIGGFLLIGLLIVGVGFTIYYLANQQLAQNQSKNISSFEDCVEAGYPVMESYPRQCAVPDGDTFVEKINQDVDFECGVDMCGDGICQEIVCEACDCPISENKQLCPEDCGNTSVGIANPASEYCEENGGTLDIRDGETGQSGYCIFADGHECEEWAYFNDECK